MAKSTDYCNRLANSVDPHELYARLASALGFPCASAEEITSADFPELDARFRDAYLLKEVLRKYPAFELGIDTHKVALSTFFEDEQLNAETNVRLATYEGANPRVRQVIFLAGQKISDVLGKLDWTRFEDGLRLGPGATTSLKRCEASVARKLSSTPHVTTSASRIWEVCLKTRPLWSAQLAGCGCEAFSVFEHDVVMVVPKNARTGRTIGKGPDANVVMQLALGYCFRKAMYRAGINLSDQSINQRRAKAGSSGSDIATVDLKSASQSVTTMLVYLLFGTLPTNRMDPRWYDLLCSLRTESCLVDNRVHTYELFSAMGNGFTFELESLIFWALSVCACEVLGIHPDVTVYGDDLTIPCQAIGFIEEVFSYCGLRFNMNKTFSNTEGHRFRESCGKHYLNGCDVSPFYVDKPLNQADQILLLANNIVRWATYPHGFGRDGRLYSLWLWVVGHLSQGVQRCRIPYGESDDGLISDFDEAAPSLRVCKSGNFMGYAVKTLERVQLKTPPPAELAYAARMYEGSYKRFTPPVNRGVVDNERFKYLANAPRLLSSSVLVSHLRLFALSDAATSCASKITVSGDTRSPIDYGTGGSKLHWSKRNVQHWPLIGPWVTPEWVKHPVRDITLELCLIKLCNG